MAERQPSKLHVASSNLVSRSNSLILMPGRATAGRRLRPSQDPHRWIKIHDVDLDVFYVVTPSAFERVGGYEDTVKDWQQVYPPQG